MSGKWPGKRCVGKTAAEMTPKELKEHRLHMRAYERHRRANFSPERKAAENKRERLRQAKPEIRAKQVAYHKKRRQEKPELCKEYAKKQIEELSTNYVKSILCKRLGLKFCEIPNDLVELKRAQLKLRRMANA
jgi:hypothetical protein